MKQHLIAIGLCVLAGFVLFIANQWEWLLGQDSDAAPLRNLVLILATPVAFALAIWRSMVAQNQARAAQRQADTAHQGLLNERYQRGAEMLGSDILAARLGGIYTLEGLIQESPSAYHVPAMKTLSSFVRHPAKKGAEESGHPCREDVQAAITVIGGRTSAHIAYENSQKFELKLNDADLTGVKLFQANLRDVCLLGVNLKDSILVGVNLNGANLAGANLANAFLWGTNLRSANLGELSLTDAIRYGALREGANLRDADLRCVALDCTKIEGIKGLKQAQLDGVDHDKGAPNLKGAFDAETGKPLTWRPDIKEASKSQLAETP